MSTPHKNSSHPLLSCLVGICGCLLERMRRTHSSRDRLVLPQLSSLKFFKQVRSVFVVFAEISLSKSLCCVFLNFLDTPLLIKTSLAY